MSNSIEVSRADLEQVLAALDAAATQEDYDVEPIVASLELVQTYLDHNDDIPF